MTQSSDADRERAEEEAAAWLLRLSEAPDDTELNARFDAWINRSALNAEIWARTARAYDLVGKGPARHDQHWQPYAAARKTERALPTVNGKPNAASRPNNHAGPWRRRLTPARLGTGAAAAALAACLIIAVLPDAMLRLEADIVTATGELRTAVLEDGTRVHLAPESAIEVSVDTSERRVRLIQGNAFFDVTRDPSKPFRVSSGDTVATVLGTAFEMRHDADLSAVAVQHGRVHVRDGRAEPPLSAELRAGAWVRISEAGDSTRGKMLPDEIAAWRRGELIARNRPAGEIVDILRRYHTGAIVMRSDTFAVRRVSGIYDLREPATTLGELAASHGAAVRRLSPWLLIVTDD